MDPLDKYISSLKKPFLTQEEENKLITLYQSKAEGWESAQEKVINSNLFFVVKLAKKYSKNRTETLNLISEGNLALLQSLNRYKPNNEAKFLTYASVAIKGAIFTYFQNNHVLNNFKVSFANLVLARKAADFVELYNLNHSRNPTSDEIAKHLEISQSKALLITDLANSTITSIDCTNEDGTSFQEKYEDSRIDNPLTLLQKKESISLIESILQSLPDKHQIIISKRFGLRGEDRTDLASIGKELKLTKERVRQIEKAAINTIFSHFKKLNKKTS